MTTIGVFLIWRTKSSALATARSPVALPRMISTSAIFSTGEKKWMPMKLAGVAARLGELADRQGRGVGGEDRVGGQVRLGAAGGLGLDGGVLEDRLDHQVAAGERGVVGGGGDAGEDLGLLLRAWCACA